MPWSADAARTFHNLGRHLDQTHSPGRRVAFAQRVGAATQVRKLFAGAACERFGRHRFDRQVGIEIVLQKLRRRRGDLAANADQQIVSLHVQEQAEQVCHVAMIAQAVRLQAALEFLVAMLTLTSVDVFVVRRGGQQACFVTMARRLVPIALISHFTMVRRGCGHERD
jgi:hypothetical protein